MYIYIYIYVYVYIYVSIYIYVHMNTDICICVCRIFTARVFSHVQPNADMLAQNLEINFKKIGDGKDTHTHARTHIRTHTSTSSKSWCIRLRYIPLWGGYDE